MMAAHCQVKFVDAYISSLLAPADVPAVPSTGGESSRFTGCNTQQQVMHMHQAWSLYARPVVGCPILHVHVYRLWQASTWQQHRAFAGSNAPCLSRKAQVWQTASAPPTACGMPSSNNYCAAGICQARGPTTSITQPTQTPIQPMQNASNKSVGTMLYQPQLKLASSTKHCVPVVCISHHNFTPYVLPHP